MCKSRKDNDNRNKDLNHVKILAFRFGFTMNCSMGIYQDGEFYRFENKGNRDYVNYTIQFNDGWKWIR